VKAESRPEGRPTATGDSLPDGSDAVEEVRVYQRTARRIVRDPRLTFIQATMAILNLIRQARSSEAPELTIAAIWSEASDFVSSGDRPLDREALVEELAAHDIVDRALRGLLRDGYVRCPECTRLLPDERELDRQRYLRRSALEDALLREEAV
jgi:hypothetical protein